VGERPYSTSERLQVDSVVSQHRLFWLQQYITEVSRKLKGHLWELHCKQGVLVRPRIAVLLDGRQFDE
jgi:hypothetical protein